MEISLGLSDYLKTSAILLSQNSDFQLRTHQKLFVARAPLRAAREVSTLSQIRSWLGRARASDKRGRGNREEGKG